MKHPAQTCHLEEITLDAKYVLGLKQAKQRAEDQLRGCYNLYLRKQGPELTERQIVREVAVFTLFEKTEYLEFYH